MTSSQEPMECQHTMTREEVKQVPCQYFHDIQTGSIAGRQFRAVRGKMRLNGFIQTTFNWVQIRAVIDFVNPGGILATHS